MSDLNTQEREMLQDDILDLIIKGGGRITKTDLAQGLRRSFNCYVKASSGRKWRLSYDWQPVEWAEELGFTVEHTYKGNCVVRTHITV